MAQGYRCSKDSGLYIFAEPVQDGTLSDTVIAGSTVAAFLADLAGGSVPFTSGAAGAGATWRQLPHIRSVEFSADVQEATRVRTSDTGGALVKACSDTTSYDANVSAYLDDADWLWNYLLRDPVNPQSGNLVRWFMATKSTSADNDGEVLGTAPYGQAAPTGAPKSPYEGAILFAGSVAPGTFSFDNESEDPAGADFSIAITVGPYFPGQEAAYSGTIQGAWGVDPYA